MTVEGVDYSFDRPSSPHALYAAGKRFACRYLAIPPNSKIITRDEADDLAAAGLWIVANWEMSGKGTTPPETAAAQALTQAHALGIPKGRPIYASVDFDVQPADYDRVRDWISRFHAGLNGEYDGRALYGSYYVIKAGLDEGWLKWGWQTYAWSHGNRDPRAQLYQHQNGVNIAGVDCDLDTAYHDDYGQWMPGKTPNSTGDDDMPKRTTYIDTRERELTKGVWQTLYMNGDGTAASIASGKCIGISTAVVVCQGLPPGGEIQFRLLKTKTGTSESRGGTGVREAVATGGSTYGTVTDNFELTHDDDGIRWQYAVQYDGVTVTKTEVNTLAWP